MKRVSRSHVVYALSRDCAPVTVVQPGERLVVETHDCRTGTITSEADLGKVADARQVNPATGPIAVAGAQPGDLLRIQVHDIRVGSRGLMLVRPGLTAFDDLVTERHLRIATVADGFARVGAAFEVPVEPMIGVVGVAPAEGSVPTLLGGPHGGNMDTRLIAAGAAVWLPVLVPDALVFVGDVHAAMGDGEVFLTGVEISGEIELSIDIVQRKGESVPVPLVETPQVIAPIATGPTLDAAARAALAAAHRLLTDVVGLDPIDAGFFLSSACHLRVSQFVPGAVIHCRVEIPRSILAHNHLRLELT